MLTLNRQQVATTRGLLEGLRAIMSAVTEQPSTNAVRQAATAALRDIDLILRLLKEPPPAANRAARLPHRRCATAGYRGL